MLTPFARLAPGHIERGFSVMPELPRSKIPGVGGRYLEGWQRFCHKQPDEAQIAAWIRDAEPDAGISLACGFGGVVALDVDNPKAYGAVREVFGGSRPPSKRGLRGSTAFFCAKGEPIASRKFMERRNERGQQFPLVEVLSTGNKTTLPPSIHPAGMPYRWHNASLEEVRPRDLPVLTQQHLADLEAALAPLMEPKRPVLLRSAAAAVVAALPENELERRQKRNLARARVALECEVKALRETCKPGRSLRLFGIAAKLGRFMHAGFLSKTELTEALLEACKENKLLEENPEHDVRRTIARAFDRARSEALPPLKERPPGERSRAA